MQKELGEAIKNQRLKMGFSQLQLSILTNMTQSSISVIEKGNGNPEVCTLVKLADALHCTPKFLLQPLSKKA